MLIGTGNVSTVNAKIYDWIMTLFLAVFGYSLLHLHVLYTVLLSKAHYIRVQIDNYLFGTTFLAIWIPCWHRVNILILSSHSYFFAAHFPPHLLQIRFLGEVKCQTGIPFHSVPLAHRMAMTLPQNKLELPLAAVKERATSAQSIDKS